MELVRCGFVEKKPAGIDALAFSPSDALLAIGRAEGVVDIFDTATWHLVKRICGEGPHKSVRSLCWIGDDKLFSAGIHGELTEWDLQHLCPKYVEHVGGGAVWALCFVEDVGGRGPSFFVACDDGVLRWFVYDGERLELRKSAKASKGRLLSVVFTGKYIFTGDSMGLVMRWGLPDLSCDTKMRLPTRGDRPTLVWALSSVHNGEQVASGDSLGNVTFWDTATCTQVQTLCDHQADVLCLATVKSAKGEREDEFLVSSGVDAKISMYSARNDATDWMFYDAAFGHTHDIRALAVDSKGTIVSGGVDATLSVQTMGGKPILLPPFTIPMRVSLSDTSVALVQHDAHAEIWYLHPPSEESEEQSAKRQKVEKPDRITKIAASEGELPKPQKLIDVALQTNGHLLASAMCPTSTFFALSNMSGTRIFSLTLEELECRKVNAAKDDGNIYPPDEPSSCLLFTGPHTLVAASLKSFKVVVIDTRTCIVQSRFKHHKASVSHLACSREWLCSADVNGQMHLYNMDTLEHYCKVPSFDRGIPTCVTFTKAQKPQVVAVSSYHQFFVFDIDSRSLQATVSIPTHILRSHHRVHGAITHPQDAEKILFWTSIGLVKANLSAIEANASEKEAISEGNEDADQNGNTKRQAMQKKCIFSNNPTAWQTEKKRFRWIQALHEIPWSPKRNSLLMLEVTPEQVQALLPTQFVRKTYGS
eukprot:GEMP01023085.1.p1 GENE.GEMP01023085.1~~GEMP01023085.1.p1  ORF type:complete len:704 (+),score=135.17 GEMP01023085.1:142-2253(+)